MMMYVCIFSHQAVHLMAQFNCLHSSQLQNNRSSQWAPMTRMMLLLNSMKRLLRLYYLYVYYDLHE